MNCARPKRSIGTGDCLPMALGSRPTLAAIVRAYKNRHRFGGCDELAGFRDERTLGAAIRRAGMAERCDGKRFSHQRRLPKTVLKAATAALHRASVRKANDFDELHQRVGNAIGSLVGIGELMVYDAALRLGAHLRLLPRRVYLHRGTRRGARALGLDWRAKSIALSDCPRGNGHSVVTARRASRSAKASRS